MSCALSAPAFAAAAAARRPRASLPCTLRQPLPPLDGVGATARRQAATTPRPFRVQSSSQSATAAGERGTSGSAPPEPPSRWMKRSPDEQRAYLEAVQKHFGEGVVVEDGPAIALLDADMVDRVWKADGLRWKVDRQHGCIITKGQVVLRRLIAAQLLFGGKAFAPPCFSSVLVRHADGCPGNCLQRNLVIAPVGMAGVTARRWAEYLLSFKGREGEMSPLLRQLADQFLPAYQAAEERAVSDPLAARERRAREARSRRLRKATEAVLEFCEKEGEAETLRFLGQIGRVIEERGKREQQA